MKEKKNCPFCGEEIMATAIKCKHCGEFLNKEETKKEETKTEKPKSKTKWREYIVFGFIIIILFSFIKSCLDTPIQTTTRHSSTVQTTVQEDSSVPKEYRNALKKAKRYAESLYMSKQGIYDQLVSEYGEGFSADSAQYAIDNLDRDYKDNALKKAKKYQDSLNMSKQKVYEQLISEHGEKFTKEEAQFAIDNL